VVVGVGVTHAAAAPCLCVRHICVTALLSRPFIVVIMVVVLLLLQELLAG